MRYLVLATDYDGTLADQGRVTEETLQKLKEWKAGGRKLILVTGRELKDLVAIFPDYKIFDFVIAENGAVIHEPATGQEKLLGPPPDPAFVRTLEDKGVRPISVGRVIVATWEPHEQTVLEAIKTSGSEHQVIFNKGAVMILPPGINKATGLQVLLRSLHFSLHNTVAVGDAENDNALLQAAECSVAVSNALPSLKTAADWVTNAAHGSGVVELIDAAMRDDLSVLDRKLTRHWLEIGTLKNGSPFCISPYRSGILLSGVSGSGKTTLTLSLAECLDRLDYQFCLVDPEGDYLDLTGAVVVGNDASIPTMDEIKGFLKDPAQNLVICMLSIPLSDRPAFFTSLLSAFQELRREFGRPHWILLDEAHHLVPDPAGMNAPEMPADFNSFMIISTSTHALNAAVLSKIGMLITIGKDSSYPFEQFGKILQCAIPETIPVLGDNEICVWDRDTGAPPFVARYHLPQQLRQRHKKKYAQGDMTYNSFVFTGPENKLHLVANNLMLFIHIAEGIDTDTWLFHLYRRDFSRWFSHTVHDGELAAAAEEAEKMTDPAASKKHILESITRKYTA